MVHQNRRYLAPLFSIALGLLGAASAGCTVTTTSGAPTCVADSTVVGCVGNSQGYSCTGTDTPDESNSALTCSDARAANGAFLYCCVQDTIVVSTCKQESNLGCTDSFGFSCTGNARPDSNGSLVCSDGTVTSSGANFCCVTAGTETGCTRDSTVHCDPTSYGFTCTGTATPDSAVNASLNCSTGTPTASGAAFCCNTGAAPSPPATTAGSCTVDTNVSCPGATGLSCTGGATPDTTTYSCGSGVAEASGAMGFCCTSASTDNCVADTTITRCGTDGHGFTCTGSAIPSTTDRSVICDLPTAGASGHQYCCYATTGTSTCAATATVTDCVQGAVAYVCTGTDTPETDTNSALLCAADPGGAAKTQCCAPQH